MRKVAILAFGDEIGGGVYQYTQSVIDALKNNTTSHYIIFCDSNSNFETYHLETRVINRIKTKRLQKIIRALQCLFYIRKPLFFNSQELEVFKDIELFISPVISLYPHFFLNKPFIFTLHDMQERYYPEFFTIKERILRWINNRSLSKGSHRIICESEFVKKDIIRFTGVSANKISIIQSPPPQSFLNYKIEDDQLNRVRAKYALPEKFIFYPAQCWFHKNHIKLLEAFSILVKSFHDIHLILTGSQQNNYFNVIKRINELSLDTKVRHLGFIDYQDLPYFYKMSQFLVMPSLFESISIPIYEAFSLQVAVCSSNVVALPEQVGDAGLIFNPNDINDMAEKMMFYLSDEKLRQQKARLGFERLHGFNHENYQDKLLGVLNDIF